MTWVKVEIETLRENEEKVSNILYDLGVQGLSIEDPEDVLNLIKNKNDWELVDEALVNRNSKIIKIDGYFSASRDLQNKIQVAKQSIEKLGKVTISKVYEEDWSKEWKKYYKPIRVGQDIVIKPSWEDYETKEDDITIELDPGMAFGTGTHETTVLCIEGLEKYIKPNDLVFDIGCGSGILSIAAAKLGARKVLGVDIDKLAVDVARENAIKNKVDKIVDIKNGDLLDVVTGKADLVVVNILAEVIIKLTPQVKKYLKDENIFIVSGIIKEKQSIVEKTLRKNNFTILETKVMDSWVAMIAKYRKGWLDA